MVLALVLAAGVDGGDGDVVKRLGAAAAQIEDAGAFRVVQKVQVDLHHIFHRNKVAHLAAVGVAVVAFKQFHLAGLQVLVEVMKGHRGHAAFVLFARAVDVEVTKAHHLRAAQVKAAAHHLVEQKFRIAIHVQRGFVFA